MRSHKLLLFFLLTIIGTGINALPNMNVLGVDCGNGITCASSQTCMSNTTGAGLVYACSPLSNAVRCTDARFSCPFNSNCVDDNKCIFMDGNITDAINNIDAFYVSSIRDFGMGMKPTSLSICGSIVNNFRLPNFCNCQDAKLGGNLQCTIGIQNRISIGASAWILPCASPANVGYRAWVSLLGMSQSVGRTWTASFSVNVPIPGATLQLGLANAGVNAQLSGNVERLVITTRFDIGVCGQIRIGFFSEEICNPSILTWLPITILRGPRFDFSRLC